MESSLHPETASPLADFLSGQNLLLWGLGKEGLSSYRFLRRHFPEKELTLADDRIGTLRAAPPFAADPHLRFLAAPLTPAVLDSFDLILKSPGIPTAALNLSPALTAKLTGQADLFLRFAAGRIVGITGTKGKSTTSHLLAHFLRAGNIDVHLGGNIGIPLWDFIDELRPTSVTVAELSSYQLEHARHSPHIAIWLNLYEEHLNYHGTFAAYRDAKANLARHLAPTGHLIHRADDPRLAEALAPLNLRAHLHPFTAASHFPYSLEGNRQLPGPHNALNAFAALTAARLLASDEAAIPRALENFRSLPHRLEYLGTFAGVRYYNDSISTVPEATLAALAALPETDVLILGGMNRGVSYQALAEALHRPGLRHVLLLPETGAIVGKLLEPRSTLPGAPQVTHVETLEEAVAHARRVARPGGTCLFSPAASSYHRYRNFEERGEAFRALVREIGE